MQEEHYLIILWRLSLVKIFVTLRMATGTPEWQVHILITGVASQEEGSHSISQRRLERGVAENTRRFSEACPSWWSLSPLQLLVTRFIFVHKGATMQPRDDTLLRPVPCWYARTTQVRRACFLIPISGTIPSTQTDHHVQNMSDTVTSAITRQLRRKSPVWSTSGLCSVTM